MKGPTILLCPVPGAEREQKSVYAGITTYEKKDGTWMRVANVSTFEPRE